jgi:threonyl-tRNA synthetase
MLPWACDLIVAAEGTVFADVVGTRDRGLRAEIDDRDATLGARIRDAQHDKVPYVAIIGRREANDASVAIRLRDGRQLEPTAIEDFVALVATAAERRGSYLLNEDAAD